MARISRSGQFYHSARFGPQVDCTITLEPLNVLLSSVGRGVCHGVTRRDTTRLHRDVRFRATAAISVPGGSWHTRSYRDQVSVASLLSDAVAGSVITTRCVWPEFAISAYARSRCLSTITVRVYSIEPGPIIVTRRTGTWLV